MAVMAIAPVVAAAVDAVDAAGGEAKALVVRLFGIIQGGSDELLLSPRTGVLKQLLCWESLRIIIRPKVSGTGQKVEAKARPKTKRYGLCELGTSVANTEPCSFLAMIATLHYQSPIPYGIQSPANVTSEKSIALE